MFIHSINVIIYNWQRDTTVGGIRSFRGMQGYHFLLRTLGDFEGDSGLFETKMDDDWGISISANLHMAKLVDKTWQSLGVIADTVMAQNTSYKSLTTTCIECIIPCTTIYSW